MKSISEHGGVMVPIILLNYFKNYFDFIKISKKVKLKKTQYSKEEWSDKKDAQLFSTIIGATLVLEAFINDYGARQHGKYFDQYLERIDLLSKCVIIPKLSEGIDLEMEPQLLHRLKRLIKVRNRFVHPKLFAIPENPDHAKQKWKSVVGQWTEANEVANDSLKFIYDFFHYLSKQKKSPVWADVIEKACAIQISAGKYSNFIRYR